ncbi:hypothetical protein [Bradyrhizobium sp. WSM1743]|uniref:hypothetical protein n=1 Tax=Bradyrhizobium sp. WSM1743 TaxID=318996 RepID=UPI0004876F34|nr:hypothetical protein [Bradyrhizobium sp. WSM1743]
MSLDPTEPYSVAKGYVQSAHAMMSNPHRLQTPDDTPFYLAFHMLCGFATELYFKAFLGYKGYTDAELRHHSIRHDLAKLRDLCRSKGLFDTGGDLLVDLLAEKHKTFEYRYMRSTSVFRAVDLQAMFSAFSSLDRVVGHRGQRSER